MADEMDESLGAERKKPNPEETTTEGVNAASIPGPAVEAAAEVSEGEQGIAASDLADDGSVAVQTLGEVESQGSSATPEHRSAEALYEAAPTVAQREPHRAQTASASSGSTGGGAAHGSQGSSRVEGGELDRPGLDLLYDVELDATLQFGSKEMLLRDVLELGPGDVVELDRHIAQPVDLVVGDRIVARGEVVVASGNFALRVTEVATPQMRLESIRCLF